MTRKLPAFLTTRKPSPPVTPVEHTPAQRRQMMMCAAMLLRYPGEDWPAVLDAVGACVEGRDGEDALPKESGRELGRFIDWAQSVGQREVETLYVTTFDQKRRCCLELSYYLTGDTRQRGIALSVFQDLYAACGWEKPRDHLPDFLPFILEMCARADDDSAQIIDNIIASHREGIELLHAALADLSSPWTHVVAALRMALPCVDDATRERMQELIRKGPPSELVGLDNRMDLPWPADHPLAGTPMPTESEK